MKVARLKRFKSTAMATTGVLHFGGQELHTLERPWIPTHPGGAPRRSSVPAGRYDMIHHTRTNGDKVVALVNPGLGVYYLDSDRTNECGRFMILLHAANYVDQLEGCIAPGTGAAVTDRGPMVTSSRDAMAEFMRWIGDDDGELIIEDEL
jgi:hypothetical protein